MGDLEPARGNLHVCKFLRDLTNIKYARWRLERVILSECVDWRTRCYNLEKEGRKDETEGERKTEGRRKRARVREREEGKAQEKEGQKRSSQYALKRTWDSVIVSSVRYYLPTPPLGQDMTQGQFFKRSLTGWNS